MQFQGLTAKLSTKDEVRRHLKLTPIIENVEISLAVGYPTLTHLSKFDS